MTVPCKCIPSIGRQFGYNDELDVEYAQSSFLEEKIQPMNGLNCDPYIFEFEPMSDSFLCMGSMSMCGMFSIVRADGAAVDVTDEDAAPNNFIGSTLWQSVETKINDVTINPSSAYNAGYKNYMETILSYEERADQFLKCNYFYEDQAGKFSNFKGSGAGDKNKGHFYRFQNMTGGAEGGTQFCAPICNDFIRSNNHLAPNHKLTLRFVRASDDFVLNHAGDKKYKIILKDLAIYVRRVRIRSDIMGHVMRNPGKAHEHYQSNYTEVKDFAIGKGLQQWRASLISGGRLPKQIIVGMVSTKAYLGATSEHPFHFQHFNLNRINLVINNNRVPQDPLSPDFENNLCNRSLHHLFQNTGKCGPQRGLWINQARFVGGYAFFPFDLTPDLCNGLHTHAGKDGFLELEMEWAKPLTDGITVLMHVTYDQIVSISPLGHPESHLF